MKRREFLRLSIAGVAGLAVAACTRQGPSGPALPDGTPEALAEQVRALLAEGQTYGLQVFPGAQGFIAGRDNRVPLGLVDPEGITISGGEAQVWNAAEGREASGPVDAVYRSYARVVAADDPRGFYQTTVSFLTPGLTDLLVSAGTEDGFRLFGWTTVHARARATVPDIGEAAIPVTTPTVGDRRGVANLCTREPACPLHDRPLDALLDEERPIVLTIASPLLCTSRTCGPVLEEVLAIHARYGDRVAFVHAEPYQGQTSTRLAETATAWRLESEPWTFVIARDGTVAGSFEGPVVAAEIEPIVRSLAA